MKKYLFALVSGVLALGLFPLAHAGSSSFDKQMAPVLEAYLEIPAVLAADKTDRVESNARKIEKLASRLDASTVTGKHAKHYATIPSKLEVAAAALAKAKGIDKMREALKELSKPMALWATMSLPKGISVMYCSMAPGSWLQKDTLIANPYYGAKMLRCGEIVAGEGAAKKK